MDPAAIPKPSRLPLGVFVVVAALLAAAGMLLHRSMREGARARGAAELDAVAALKASAVSAWRAEREADAVYAASFPFVVAAATDPVAAEHGLPIYQGLAARHGLGYLALLRPDGVPLVEHRAAPGPPPQVALVRRALEGSAPALSSLSAEAGQRSPRLDVAVPVRDRSGAAVAAVYAQVDAGPFLAAAVAGWPVPSATGEAVVVRPDGDAVLFVTDPRFLHGWALQQRIPFSDEGRGVVRATRGEGVFQGVDVNATRILVASRRVPASDWLVATRMNLDEIEAPLLGPAGAIGWGLAVLLSACGLALAAWRRRELEQHRALVAAREALEESRERLRLALAGTHLVWEWDLDRGAFDADPEAAAHLGLPAASLRGAPAEIVHRLARPEDAAAALARLEAHRSGAAPLFEVELRSGPAEGPERWLLLRGRASRRDAAGRAQRITGVASDVTERRALQATLARSERMASLGTLAAGIAHEINNPLAYLIDSLEVLGELLPATGRADLAEAAANARDGAARVRDVVQGLRVFSRQGPGQRAPVDVAAELVAATRVSANQLRHRAQLELRIGSLPRVMAGQHELGQVFLNLLLNAAQAIPEGHVTENLVVVEAMTDAEGQARVEVRDSGAGIAPEVLPRIFEPFFSTKPVAVGTGLGLAITHGIVAAAGGRIEVESAPGHGSTFRVILPPAPREAVELAEEAIRRRREAAPRTPPELPQADAERPRVLVIDDDAPVARSLARALGQAFAVETETSAKLALERLLRREPFAAVVCDLMMPEMTGMELHQRACAADPSLSRRFVFVTGGAFTDSAREFLERTDAPCVGKPFQPAELRALVAKVAAAASGPAGAGVR